MTPGQVADISGAVMLAGHLPKARYLLADKGYDADDWLVRLHIQPVIPNRSNGKAPYAFDARRYKNRNVISACSVGSRTSTVSPPATTKRPKTS